MAGLLNLRLADDVDQDTFARKSTEIRDRLASIKLQMDALDRSHDETAELAPKCLNFRKGFASSGLPPITTRSVASSKSCV